MEINEVIKVLDAIATDAENDSIEFDGQIFNGKTVGTYYGYHGAAIASLAKIVKGILENELSKVVNPG